MYRDNLAKFASRFLPDSSISNELSEFCLCIGETEPMFGETEPMFGETNFSSGAPEYTPQK